MASPDAVTDLY